MVRNLFVVLYFVGKIPLLMTRSYDIRCRVDQTEPYTTSEVERNGDLELIFREKHHPENLTHLSVFTIK